MTFDVIGKYSLGNRYEAVMTQKKASVPALFEKKRKKDASCTVQDLCYFVQAHLSICLEKVLTRVSVHFSAPADPSPPPLPPPVWAAGVRMGVERQSAGKPGGLGAWVGETMASVRCLLI